MTTDNQELTDWNAITIAMNAGVAESIRSQDTEGINEEELQAARLEMLAELSVEMGLMIAFLDPTWGAVLLATSDIPVDTEERTRIVQSFKDSFRSTASAMMEMNP